MNPNDRKPDSSGASGKKNASGGAPKREVHPDFNEEDMSDWFDSEEYKAFKAGNFSAAEPKRTDSLGEDDVEDEEDAVSEAVAADLEDGDSGEADSSASKKHRTQNDPGKSFFETLGDGLRSAGQTAQRYTQMGLARAQLEKLRFDLKSAHAHLGELAMHCWADAPDVDLSSKDPAVVGAIKRIRQIRLKIREKQAKIADLRKEKA